MPENDVASAQKIRELQDWHLSWTPDGRRLAFGSVNGDFGLLALESMRAGDPFAFAWIGPPERPRLFRRAAADRIQHPPGRLAPPGAVTSPWPSKANSETAACHGICRPRAPFLRMVLMRPIEELCCRSHRLLTRGMHAKSTEETATAVAWSNHCRPSVATVVCPPLDRSRRC